MIVGMQILKLETVERGQAMFLKQCGSSTIPADFLTVNVHGRVYLSKHEEIQRADLSLLPLAFWGCHSPQ